MNNTPSAEVPRDDMASEEGSAGQGARKEKQSTVSAIRQTIIKWARITVGSLMLLMVGLLILAWYSAIPLGQLRLFPAPDVADDPDKLELANGLFQLADAAVSDAELYHRQLFFALDDGVYNVSIPPPANPGGTGLRQFISEMSVRTLIKQESTNVAVVVNALALLEKSYELLGFHDYFVVIREIEPEPCRSPAEERCWRIVAQYWPSLMRPDEFTGTKNELARDLAMLVLRGAVQDQGEEWRRRAVTKAKEAPPFPMAPEIPASMADLEAAALGLNILRLGESHPKCVKEAKTKVDCINLALSAFQLNNDRDINPVAAFGRALIELDAALVAARKLGPELTVERHLSNAEVLTSLAQQSEFLRSRMKRADLGSRFKLLELHDVALGDASIHLSRRFACALANRRRANWQSCVSEIGKLDDFPPALSPYVEAALIDASLTGANANDFYSQFKALIQRLSSSSDTNAEHTKHLLREVVLKHACERQEVLDDRGFAALVQETTTNAPHQSAFQGVIVLAAACRQGQSFPSEADLQGIIASVERMQGEERHRFELLLALYQIRRGRLEAALDLARRALPLPWTGPYVLKSPEFAEMIKSPDHRTEFIQASLTTTLSEGLESCPRLE